MGIAFQVFVNFGLVFEGITSTSAVYSCLECRTKVFFTFVLHSIFLI